MDRSGADLIATALRARQSLGLHRRNGRGADKITARALARRVNRAASRQGQSSGDRNGELARATSFREVRGAPVGRAISQGETPIDRSSSDSTLCKPL